MIPCLRKSKEWGYIQTSTGLVEKEASSQVCLAQDLTVKHAKYA